MFRSPWNLTLLSNLALLMALALPVNADTTPTRDTGLFSADGFRQDRYRSPTPAKAPGATTVDTAALQALLERHTDLVLIDVINVEYRHQRFLQDQPHPSIPNAHWLPNTGKGQLEPRWQRYLMDNLARLTGERPDHPVAVFCKSDCWLSWNAVKRLTEAGYRNVYWFKDGIDSWIGAGLPTRAATPVPLTQS
ncbi:rhodanese-like domain-containing protein [Marinobacter bohaiensis]|uniref:rhodanese-like domain-containing protein n=1 Tax=Marinobacter bohaiensis TaxID=2201898 RepID=UPI000DAE528D|nr:rhodanese-like domain-containing protein [Marinobacter bohaiensis]